MHIFTVILLLQTNTVVSYLDISDNGLEGAGGIAIATMLKDNNYIVHLVRRLGNY